MTRFWGIFGHPSFLETCSVVLQLNSDKFFFCFLDWSFESREAKFSTPTVSSSKWGAVILVRPIWSHHRLLYFMTNIKVTNMKKYSREICQGSPPLA